ncbi:polysaccharide deacetylase family protein [Chloroflexota bacterium]
MRRIRWFHILTIIILALLLVPLSPVYPARLCRSEEKTTTVALTFDDGSSDWVSNAMPILASYNLTATAFLLDPDHLQDFTWEDARELYNAGWEIGWHTVLHTDLSMADSETITSELSPAKTLFQSHGLPAPETFAYPYGGHDNKSMAIVSQYFAAARTVHQGVNTPCDVLDNAYHLKTITVKSLIGNDVPFLEATLKKYRHKGVFIVPFIHTVGEPASWQEKPDITVEEFADLAKLLYEEEKAGNIDVVTFREGVSRFEQRESSRSWGLEWDSPFDKFYYISVIPVPARYYDFYMEAIIRNFLGHRFPEVERWVERIDVFRN